MPSKTKLRTELGAVDNYKLDLKKSSRHHHHHGTKIPQDKALSPKASNSLKFKDKAGAVSPVRPPHADLPFEFLKDVGKGIYVGSTATVHNQQQRTHVKKAAPAATSRARKEEELVKYMSKLPSYLQSGGNVVQDNVLNFGVLDWKRLERWKQKQNGTCGRDGKRTGSSVASSSSTSTLTTSSSGSRFDSSNKVDKPRDEGRKETNPPQHSNKQAPTCTQQELSGDASGVKFPRVPEKGSYQKSNLGPRTSSDHPATDEVSSSSKEKNADSNYQRDQDRAAKGKNPDRQQHSHCKKDKVFLLLPKDFSTPSSSEISRRTSSFDDGGFSGLSWSSFSDVFSIEEVDSEDSFLNIPHSCPLTCTSESESELDFQLDNLVHSQGSDLESDLPCLSSELSKTTAAASNIKDAKNNSENKYVLPEAPKGSEEQEAAGSLNSGSVDSSSSRRFSFGIGRLGRSLSLRESGAPPHEMSSKYFSAMSGPVRTDVPAASDCSGTNTTIGNGKTKNSTFKRLLDPWLKHRAAAKQFSRTQSTQSYPDDLDDFNFRPGSALESLFRDKSTAPTAKALLQVTFKGGLPLFKFLAETNNEILASTVKKLSTLEKDDDPNWLYTFYSVHKVRRKRGGWKNQVSKHKNTEFSYTVVGQMKVSNARVPVEQGEVTKHKVMESALYGVDLNKTEEPTSEFTANRELAAVVVKLPVENLSTKADIQSDNLSSGFSDRADENERLGSVVVILPSGFHALPTEGVPSSLINRWRSGGLCDCGGWDVGCRLRVLTNVDPDDKTRGASRASFLHDRCDLFVQGAGKQTRPIFSLVSHGNGVFSVEYDAAISSLQAFSICVGFVNGQKVAGSLGQRLHNELGRDRERIRTPIDMCGDGPAKYAAYPPHSTVERV